MNNETDSRKLNVIHLKQSYSGVTPICRPIPLLWPCLAWNVVVPIRPKSNLNIFATLVLKLAEKGISPKSAHYPVALHKDLMKLVVASLQEKQFLSPAQQLTRQGAEYLEAEKETEVEYESATVFTDLCTGKLLPLIISGSPQYCTGARWDKSKICYKPNLIDADDISAWVIFVKEDNIARAQLRIPSPEEVLNAWKEHNRRYKRHAALGRNGAEPPDLSLNGVVSVAPHSELVYLASSVIIPENNPADSLVTDGSGISFSSSFAEVLKRINPKWLAAAKEKWVEEVKNSEPGAQKKLRWRYPALTSLCKKAFVALRELEATEVTTTHSEFWNTKALNEAVKYTYDAIELAFALVRDKSVTEDLVKILKGKTDEQRLDSLVTAAQNLRLDTEFAPFMFGKLSPGKLDAALTGKPELETMLALCVAEAAMFGSSPMCELAAGFPSLLTWLYRGKVLRNSFAHSWALPQDVTLEEGMFEFAKSIPSQGLGIISMLLPDAVEELRAVSCETADATLDGNELLAIQVKLEKYFSPLFLADLPLDLRNLLQHLAATHLKAERCPEDTVCLETLKCCISAMLEEILRRINRELYRGAEMADSCMVAERMVALGFYSSVAEVPLALLGANNKRHLKSAPKGINATLGSLVLALFHQADESRLQELYSRHPEAMDLITVLIKKRGHGNAGVHTNPMTPQEVEPYYALAETLVSLFLNYQSY